MSKTVLGGAGTVKIELAALPFPVNGFTGIHDPLHARTLFLKGEETFVLVSVELTSLPNVFIEELRKELADRFSLEERQIWLTVSHTFSAPHLSSKTPELIQTVKNAVYQSVEKAAGNLVPAALSFGSVQSEINVNRNVETPFGWWLGKNPQEFSNHIVRLLTITARSSEKPLAVIINFDVQSAVMNGYIDAEGNRLISSDLMGYICRSLEKEAEQSFTAFPLLGAAGDQAPVLQACESVITSDGIKNENRSETGFSLIKEVGDPLLSQVREWLNQCQCEAKPIRMSAFFEEVWVPEKVMPIPTKELVPAKAFDFSLTGRKIPIRIEGILLGEVLFLGTQPELNSSFGLEILGASPYPQTLIGSMVNGAIKYLPEALDFERITYTGMNSPLGKGSSQLVFNGFQQLFQRLTDT